MRKPETPALPPRYEVLGARISALTMDRATEAVAGMVESGGKEYVCVCNVHTIVESLRSEEVRAAVNGAWIATPDGMPLVWWGRLAGIRDVGRVYGPGLMRRCLLDERLAGMRHYLYGATEEVLDQLVAALTRARPGVRIVGRLAPPFRPLSPEEEGSIAAQIDAAKPDIVWVGLGCPKQDLWMARMRPKLQAPVLVGVGAAFDFLAGLKPQAPRLVQRAGLEWLFRLACEPRRLWRRYLVGNSVFLMYALAYASGLWSPGRKGR